MIISLETADYLKRAVDTITAGKVEIPLTDTCPECGDKLDSWLAASDEAHLVMQTTSDTYAVLVGCEGYWVINPGLIGLPRGMWQDWTDNPLGDEATGIGSDEPVCILEPDPEA